MLALKAMILKAHQNGQKMRRRKGREMEDLKIRDWMSREPDRGQGFESV